MKMVKTSCALQNLCKTKHLTCAYSLQIFKPHTHSQRHNRTINTHTKTNTNIHIIISNLKQQKQHPRTVIHNTHTYRNRMTRKKRTHQILNRRHKNNLNNT